MNQIADYPLWIGHAGDGRDFQTQFDRGIRAIVQLAAEEAPIATPRDFLLLRIPLDDGSGNDAELLSLAITSVASLISNKFPTLVCCGAGMSRAPAVVAAALSLIERRSPAECIKTVTDHHPADVLPGFWEDVTRSLAARPPAAAR